MQMGILKYFKNQNNNSCKWLAKYEASCWYAVVIKLSELTFNWPEKEREKYGITVGNNTTNFILVTTCRQMFKSKT